jgi:hypothetical protein
MNFGQRRQGGRLERLTRGGVGHPSQSGVGHQTFRSSRLLDDCPIAVTLSFFDHRGVTITVVTFDYGGLFGFNHTCHWSGGNCYYEAGKKSLFIADSRGGLPKEFSAGQCVPMESGSPPEDLAGFLTRSNRTALVITYNMLRLGPTGLLEAQSSRKRRPTRK